jgi:hypothetical protein
MDEGRFDEKIMGLQKPAQFVETVREPYFTPSAQTKITSLSLAIGYLIGPGALSRNRIILARAQVERNLGRLLC